MSVKQLDLKAAHKASIFHRAQIEKRKICGCFYCETVFAPDSVEDWTDTNKPMDQWTALCPECGIDAVIGDASGFALAPAFLLAMKQHWFGVDEA